jgi:hypothetical protein
MMTSSNKSKKNNEVIIAERAIRNQTSRIVSSVDSRGLEFEGN